MGSNEDSEHGPLAVDDHSNSKTTEAQEEMDTTPQSIFTTILIIDL